ncbi:MAG: rubrerythrin family protein [Anaerolineaceae bacterium]|nr:rubrerythrin family protein [Anaerolineaceae bacterium]
MSKSNENLQAAFAGESQANRRYLLFAEQADKEGHPQVARLFRAAAAAETVHAHSHMRVLGALKTTSENLDAAVNGENYEATTMYPDFIKAAEEEDNARALRTFKYALEAEKVHEQLFRSALESLGEEEEAYDYYVCPVCGYTHGHHAPDKCPVCGAKGERFLHIK